MAKKANAESGRTSLDFPLEIKSLLLKLCEQENKSMAAMIGDALATHQRWLAQIKGQAIEAPAPSGEAKMVQRGGRKAQCSPRPSPFRQRR